MKRFVFYITLMALTGLFLIFRFCCYITPNRYTSPTIVAHFTVGSLTSIVTCFAAIGFVWSTWQAYKETKKGSGGD